MRAVVAVAGLALACSGGARTGPPVADGGERPVVAAPDGPASPPVAEAQAPARQEDAAVDGPAAPRVAAPDAAARGARDAAAAAVTDASAPMVGGPSPPCRFHLCESFESYADGAKPDPAIWRSGDVAVGSTRAARGQKALHVVSSGGSGGGYIGETRVLPRSGGAYGRMFLRVEKKPASYAHWNMILASPGATGGGDPEVRYGGFAMPGGSAKTVFGFNIYTQTRGETGATDDQDIAALTWHCIEWYLDTPTSEARFWWNGQERPKLHWLNGRPAEPQFSFPEFKSINIGLVAFQKFTGSYDVWIDEIALHDQRIGCGP